MQEKYFKMFRNTIPLHQLSCCDMKITSCTKPSSMNKPPKISRLIRLAIHAGHFNVFSLLVKKKKKNFHAFSVLVNYECCFFVPRACGDEESFGGFRENFIQPVVLYVPPRGFHSSVRGLKVKQPWGEGQRTTHLLYNHGQHRHGKLKRAIDHSLWQISIHS